MKHTARFLAASLLLAGSFVLAACAQEAPEENVSEDLTPVRSSEVLSVETGERPHCEAGSFTYTEKVIQLAGTQITACEYGRAGYVDVRSQYARDVSGTCDGCGFHQEDVREEFWWGDAQCEKVPEEPNAEKAASQK